MYNTKNEKTMSNYIKPATIIVAAITHQMIAQSVKLDPTNTPITNNTDNWTDLSKENNMDGSSGVNLWEE